MNIDSLRSELDELARLAGWDAEADGAPWALFGSTVLLLHGLRDTVGDVDVFVAPALWQVLAGRLMWSVRLPDPADPPFLERRVAGLHAHAFYAWTAKDPEVDAEQCRRAAELVHGWWCTPLQIIRMHKAMSVPKHPGDARQAKHVRDIATIDAYLAIDAYLGEAA